MWVNVYVTLYINVSVCVCVRVMVVHMYLLFQACCDARHVHVIVCYVPVYIINRQ